MRRPDRMSDLSERFQVSEMLSGQCLAAETVAAAHQLEMRPMLLPPQCRRRRQDRQPTQQRIRRYRTQRRSKVSPPFVTPIQTIFNQYKLYINNK